MRDIAIAWFLCDSWCCCVRLSQQHSVTRACASDIVRVRACVAVSAGPSVCPSVCLSPVMRETINMAHSLSDTGGEARKRSASRKTRLSIAD